MMNSVSVKILKIKWLLEGQKNFLDLVKILNETKSMQIVSSKLVCVLISGYWDIYFTKIFRTQFLPFIFYMFGMISFLLLALEDKIEHSLAYYVLYYPLFGYCSIFIVN